MPKKKNSKVDRDENKKGNNEETNPDEEMIGGEDSLDPSIIEDTFSEEFSEYNDVDNF